MNILHSVGVVSRGPLGPGQFKYNYYPLFAVHPCFCFFIPDSKFYLVLYGRAFGTNMLPNPNVMK